MHVHAVARAAQSYEHIDPAARRQRAADSGQRAVRPVEHHRADRPSTSWQTTSELMDKILDAGRGSGEPGLPVRGGRGVVRPAGPPSGRHVPAALRAAARITSNVERDKHGELAGDRGDREAADRRRGAARSGRGRRPGERPRRRAAQGPGRRTFPTSRRCGWSTTKSASSTREAGTAARVRVVIESRDEHDVWGTVGVSENIIEASWLALVDAIEYKLFKDETRHPMSRERQLAEKA